MRIEILVLCGAVFLSGCISVSSGERTVEQGPTTRTLGRQLMDLKADYDRGRQLMDLKADYDRGRISEQEYNQRRDRLLGK